MEGTAGLGGQASRGNERREAVDTTPSGRTGSQSEGQAGVRTRHLEEAPGTTGGGA